MENKRAWPPWVESVTHISHFLTTLNSSVNFYVYCFKHFNVISACWSDQVPLPWASKLLTIKSSCAVTRLGKTLITYSMLDQIDFYLFVEKVWLLSFKNQIFNVGNNILDILLPIYCSELIEYNRIKSTDPSVYWLWCQHFKKEWIA